MLLFKFFGLICKDAIWGVGVYLSLFNSQHGNLREKIQICAYFKKCIIINKDKKDINLPFVIICDQREKGVIETCFKILKSSEHEKL